MTARAQLRRLWDQRRRAAPLFLVVGLIVVADGLFGGWPREREVHFLLDPELRTARQVRIEVASGGETLSSLRLRFAEGVPEPLVHRPTLAEGRYDATVDLTFADGRTLRRKRVLNVPFEGVMRFRLEADSQR